MNSESGGHGEASLPDDRLVGRRLTARETEVVTLVVEGKSNKEIARSLNISRSTVKAHLSSLMRKLGVESRTQAAVSYVKTSKQ